MNIYMRKPSPEMAEALGAVCRDPAVKIAALSPDLDVEIVSSCLSQIWLFLKDNKSELGELGYILELRFGECPVEKKQLSSQYILDCLNQGTNVIKINDNLDTLGFSNIEVLGVPEISEYSRSNQCCVIHIINGIDFRIYHNGSAVKDMNINNLFSQSLTTKRHSRQASDYKESIINHYHNRIRFAQFSTHWDPPGDREKRILHGERKTEMIFHNNLWNWLEENLNASVYGMVNKLSSDQTDIEIRAREPKFYIIEVKWLGTNSSNTTYSWDRLESGVTQVKNYLDIEPQCLEACLVTYDGRELEEFRKLEECDGEADQWKEFRKCNTKEFPPKGKGLLFFLESQTASIRNR